MPFDYKIKVFPLQLVNFAVWTQILLNLVVCLAWWFM